MWKTRGISFWFYSPTCKFADGPDSSFLYLNQRINCTDTHHSYPCFLLTEFVLLKQKLELHKTAFRMALFLQEESLSNAMPQAHPSHRNTIPLSSQTGCSKVAKHHHPVLGCRKDIPTKFISLTRRAQTFVLQRKLSSF